MASRFSVEALFKAVDKISQPMRKMGLNSKNFTKTMRKDFARAQRQVNSFGRSVRKNLGRFTRRIIAGGVAAIGVGIGLAAREFVNFDEAITAASAKFGPFFQRGTEGFETLGRVAREVGATTEFTATQAAQGLDFLALAGFEASQAMALLPPVVDLATAAQTDLATASDIASDSLGAFGLMTKDSTQLATNFNRVMDVMAKTTTTSNTDLETLFESVKKGAPAFTAAGQSLETFNAFAGIMANAGVKGSESGTQLRNVMLRLAKPTDDAAAVLKGLEVKTADASGNFRDIIDILADFEKGLEGMGTAQRSAALATVFGARSVTGINLLLSEGTDSLRQYRTTLLESGGAAKEMADVMRESLGNQLKTLGSAALEAGFKFVSAFQENGRGAIQTITEAIRNFNVENVVEGVRKVVDVIKVMLKIVKILGPGVLAMVVAYKAYKIALIAVAVAQKILSGTMALPLIAIGLLVTAVVLLVKNWEKVSAFLRGVWTKVVDFVVGGLRKLWEWFSKLLENPFFAAVATIFAPWLTIPALIIKNWEKIKVFFSDLWNNTIKPIVEGIAKIGGKIGGFFGGGGSERRQERREARSGVITQGERVSRSISETMNRSEIIVRNDGVTAIETDSGIVPAGGSIVLPVSG